MDLIPGLEKHVRLILERRTGQGNAIERGELLFQVHQSIMLVHASDRQVRLAIESLREQGLLICNLLTGDGYYLAETMDEYQEFRRKYASYAVTIFERVRSMDAEAEKRWGYSVLQMPLI
jgi:hypothetical protein